jgi:hypothetical protein
MNDIASRPMGPQSQVWRDASARAPVFNLCAGWRRRSSAGPTRCKGGDEVYCQPSVASHSQRQHNEPRRASCVYSQPTISVYTQRCISDVDRWTRGGLPALEGDARETLSGCSRSAATPPLLGCGWPGHGPDSDQLHRSRREPAANRACSLSQRELSDGPPPKCPLA